ncbi:hypothetical protein BDZ89DRAFT_343799 [Hymenopellis radicata]|nr:hypothetical protein BDZ89DRAFT_343799 [Hymenopellis radicata]
MVDVQANLCRFSRICNRVVCTRHLHSYSIPCQLSFTGRDTEHTGAFLVNRFYMSIELARFARGTAVQDRLCQCCIPSRIHRDSSSPHYARARGTRHELLRRTIIIIEFMTLRSWTAPYETVRR